ncbi:chemotaxis protein CheW [Massilia sp. W12]|uniref:chemotaxis protein CheW n=1 Tax=Massilia sp. W12 TaxID=3126507 RepID=UPI0030CEEF6F
MKVTAAGQDVEDGGSVHAGQYLSFWVGKEVFAVGILAIKEIIQYGQLTAVPLMPSYIRGVINLRGSVVPVIDLSVRLGRGVAAVGKRSCIVILETWADGERMDIGVMVDGVSAVIEIGPENIEDAPMFGASVRADFIEGIGKLDQQFIIILDINRTFAMEELAGMDGAMVA